MKITLDTDNLKFRKFNLNDCSDREVFFILACIILLSYVISDIVGSMRFSDTQSHVVNIEKRISNVEVTLDKVIDRINTDTIERDKEKNENFITSSPKVKYSSLTHEDKKIKVDKKQFNCLARNIYWEAMHEPFIGQIAVAHITYNRLISEKWGNDFCSVVFARKQFSWTNFDNIKNASPRNEKQWKRAKYSAKLFLNGTRVANLYNSMHYHGDYIKIPKWAKTMVKSDYIGKHIFYSMID